MKPIGKNLLIKIIEEEIKTSSGLLLSSDDASQLRYKKLSGEEIPTSLSSNPIFAKNVKFSDKVYRKMILEMNASIRQQRRLSLE